MNPDMSSAHRRAAAAFNEIASAAKIAIEALATLTAIEVILHPSEEAERVGSTPANGDPY